MTVLEVISAVVLLTGVALNLLAAVGLQRFPDVFARMHAATKPATLGLVLVMLAVAANLRTVDAAAKLLLVIVLQFVTAPAGMHMVGRSAYRAKQLGPRTVRDEYGARDEPGASTDDGSASA